MEKELTKEEIELIRMVRSRRALEYFRNKTNVGKIEKADASLEYVGSCGETITLDIKINNGLIEESRFQYEGCPGLACCGTALTKLIKGKTIQEAKMITEKDLLEDLEVMPIKDFDCPLLAIKTLKIVIEKYENQKLKK